MSEPQKLKRAVIKEELVAITGDFISALILNQFIYWTERTRDIDAYIAEEKARDPDASIEPTSGWIYKKAEDMAEEVMVKAAHTTIRRYIKDLVDRNLLEQRHNPKHTWDRTWQYRVNLKEVQRLLLEGGYSLDGYRLQDFQHAASPAQHASEQNARSNVQNAQSNLQNAQSKVRNARAIPETTTETTNKSGGVASSDRDAAAAVDQSVVNRLIDEQMLMRDQAMKAAALDCMTLDVLDRLKVWRLDMLERNRHLPQHKQKKPQAILWSNLKQGMLPDDLPAAAAAPLSREEAIRRHLEEAQRGMSHAAFR